jgi:ribose-phosphate pyrophosphokinase
MKLEYSTADFKTVIVKHRGKRFSAGEYNISLQEVKADIRNATITFDSNDSILELALLVDAIKRTGVTSIALYIPYLPYSRQDRVCNKGEAFSLQVFANIINSLGFSEVITLDAHSSIATDLIKNIENKELCWLVNSLIQGFNKTNIDLVDVVLAPDKGAIHKVKSIVDEDIIPNVKFFSANKVRAKDNSTVHTEICEEFKKYLRGKEYPSIGVFDDICDGGRTFIELAKVIRQENNKAELKLYTTHGIYSNGLSELEQYYSGIVCYNKVHNQRRILNE